MKNLSKLLAVLGVLAVGVAFAQDQKAPASKSKVSAKKMMMMDPKDHDAMMSEAKGIDEQVESLKKMLAEERAKGAAMAQARASDQQIEALQRSVKQLRHEIETGPHFVDQNNPLRP